MKERNANVSGRDWDTDSESLTEEEIGRDIRKIMNNGRGRPPYPEQQAGRGRRIDEINRTVYTDEGLTGYETPRRELTKEDKKRLQKQEKAERRIRRRINAPYTFISYAFVLVFLMLIGYLVYFNIYERDSIQNSPYNKRQDSQTRYVTRGSITAADGTVLAETHIDESGRESRYYPYGNEFAHVVGYDTNGKAGLESVCNYDLLASHYNIIDRVTNEFTGQKNPGDTVVTSLSVSLQETAYSALGEHRGAVVVIDPKTGDILAMVSKPDFNPNTIAADWNDIISVNTNSQLVNRAVSGLYPPGSTFKIVTALSYFQKNATFADFSFDCTGILENSGHTVHCFDQTAHGQEDFEQAFANSCNCAFSQIGLDVGADALRSTAESLLFNQSLPCLLGGKKSSYALKASEGNAAMMQTAFGQGDTLVTPYHMALIVSAIANDGVLMKPRFVRRVESVDGNVVTKNDPESYKILMTRTESDQMKNLMEKVVTDGTGSGLYTDWYSAAGKTGSAEYRREDGQTGTHSWFVGFSGVEDPDIVVAVIAEDAGAGSTTAVPIAREIFNSYYSS